MLHLLHGKHIASVVTVTGCAASLFCMLYHGNLDLYGILKPEEDASELVVSGIFLCMLHNCTADIVFCHLNRSWFRSVASDRRLSICFSGSRLVLSVRPASKAS